MDSFQKQSHSVGEDQRREDLISPEEQIRLGVKSMEEPPSSCSPVKSSSTEVRIQDVTPPQRPSLHRFQVSRQDPLTSRGHIEVESKDNTPNKQRHCNCKNSKCLKLYCECFASGSYCNGCNCLNCHNNLENEASRQDAITAILDRNPDAFKPKIAGSPHGIKDLQEDVRKILILGRHSKGCHCKKSGCLKKYCECYQANVLCSENCKCQDCKNFEGSEDRNFLLHRPQVSETYIQQTTSAAVKHAIDMSGYLNPPRSRKRSKDASHSVAARVSSAGSHVVHNQKVNQDIGNGDTSLFSLPDNKAVSRSTTCSYRSSLSNTIQPHHVRELCSLLVSKSVEVPNKLSGAKCETDRGRKYDKDTSLNPAQRDTNEINDSPDCVLDANRIDEKPLSPATRALMCHEEHETMSEKETSARVIKSQEKEDADTSSEIYLEQERQILSSFRDYLIKLSNRGSINGTNIKTNTNPSGKEPGDEEQSRRDSSLRTPNLFLPSITGVMETPITQPQEFRSEFLRILRSRRSHKVPLVADPSKPVENPLFQDAVPSTQAIDSCPKENIVNLKEMLQEENLHLHTEAGEQGRLPLLILSLKERTEERRPAIVFMHGTNANKEWLRPWLEAYASRGYVAIALDSRYHGERADCKTAYRDALISSWRKGNTMPFIFDTVWDLIKLAEYLTQREDIDPKRIGITGISLGGMHAWFAAAADTRYSVAVPLIGVQGFRWAIDNDEWEARVNSIKPLFEEARIDLGKNEIDKELVEKVWNRIAPGLASQFDSPYSVSVIAPRPLYILNGANDPRCPLGGLEVALERAEKAYKKTVSPGNFKFEAEDGVGHEVTSFMIKESSDWFDKFLKQGERDMTSD